MAVAQSQSHSEYAALTAGCGWVDRSERGKLALSGAGAKEFLQGQVTNDVVALDPGSGCYAAFLTPKGKMLGDVRILDAEQELLLDTERIALQALFNMIRRFSIGYDATLHKRTLETGLLSLLGPRAESVCEASDLPAREHAHLIRDVAGVPARVIRTLDGIDLLVQPEHLPQIVEQLQARGAVPVSEAVVECLRVERGQPRFGVDLDESVIPQEAGLNERAVSFTKGCYVGQETVARLFYRGKPNRHLRGLSLSAPASRGEAIRLGDRSVGHLGTCVHSPTFGPIALALVRREAPPGSEVLVGEDGVRGTVVELPFGRPS